MTWCQLVLRIALATMIWPFGYAVAQQAESANVKLEILPLDQEVSLALSAAPDHLRDSAGVWALTATGFTQVRESANGFTCVVNRDHPLAIKPVCYDAEGARTILPTVLFVGDLLRQGVPAAEISRRVADGFASGRFRSPGRAGVAYMLSPSIRNFNAQTRRTDPFPPHVMVYAPNVTNADIGTSWEAVQKHRWLPFVAYEGPQGFIVVVVP